MWVGGEGVWVGGYQGKEGEGCVGRGKEGVWVGEEGEGCVGRSG